MREPTPYDTGKRLEPRAWQPDKRDPDTYGKVDFEDDAGEDVMTLYVEPDTEGGHVIRGYQHGGDGKVRLELDDQDESWEAYRERYWDAQRRFRMRSVDEVRQWLPEGITAVVLEQDPESWRLQLDEFIDTDGNTVYRDQLEGDHPMSLATIDTIVGDLEAYNWEESDSFLPRHEDRRRFLIRKEDPYGT